MYLFIVCYHSLDSYHEQNIYDDIVIVVMMDKKNKHDVTIMVNIIQ